MVTATDCLILFGKVPVPGFVKTRLCPPLSPAQAAELYEAMLNDVMHAMPASFLERRTLRLAMAMPPAELMPREPPWPGAGAPPPAASPPPPQTPAGARILGAFPGGGGFQLSRQRGEDLGERLADAFARAAADGFRRTVVRSTDSPLVAFARVEEAFVALEEAATDVVLGPDRGGGYYLVGLRQPEPRLFADLAGWPPREVFARTLGRALSLSLTVFVLPEESDVDTPEDLAALARELVRSPDPAPRTATVLAAWRAAGFEVTGV